MSISYGGDLMPILIQCPSCQRQLRVPDNLPGRKVKCPSCQTAFTAEAPGEEPEEQPRPRRPAEPPLEEQYEMEEPEQRQDREEVSYEDKERPRRRGRKSRARSAVAGPAIALMVIGGLCVGLYTVQLVLTAAGIEMVPALGAPGGQKTTSYVIGVYIGTILPILWGALLLFAGYQMKSLASYGWAMSGSILAMLPCSPCCLAGLPFGIWGVVALNNPNTKDAFR